MENAVKIAALWKNEKNGKEYFSGSINSNTRILVFANGHKSESKHPDYLVYLVPNERQEKATDQPKARREAQAEDSQVPIF